MSDISLPPSFINLFLTYFMSPLSKDIGIQSSMNPLSLSFFFFFKFNYYPILLKNLTIFIWVRLNYVTNATTNHQPLPPTTTHHHHRQAKYIHYHPWQPKIYPSKKVLYKKNIKIFYSEVGNLISRP